MKNVICCVFSLCFATFAVADELIPLFNDMPSAQNTAVKSESSSMLTNNISNTEIRKPMLGRDAEPLTSLVIAPFPNVVVEIGGKTDKTPAPESETTPQNTDAITRDTPLEIKSQSASIIAKPADIKTGQFAARYNVKDFMVADIALGDSPDMVANAMDNLGYVMVSNKKSLPLEHAKVFEKLCRTQQKLSILNEIKACILDLADENDVYYIISQQFEKKSSKDTIYVSYSSPLTNNEAMKITYINKGDNSINTNYKTLPEKQARRDAFFDLIYATYGLPDDSVQIIWGTFNDVYMQAGMVGSSYDGFIVLEDKILRDEDYLLDIEYAKDINPEITFSFAN